MQFRCFRLLLAVAVVIAAFPSPASAAQGNACSVVTRADVGAVVAKGTVTPGRLRTYAGDPTSECQYDSDAGNVVVTFDPTNRNQFLSSYKAGFASSLQTVHGIGDEALFYQQHGTLLIRKGKSVLMLTLDTPDQARGHAILWALAHRVVPRLH
jgi:hypothetical protein